MAKSNAGLLVLGAVAVGGIVLLATKKASASEAVVGPSPSPPLIPQATQKQWDAGLGESERAAALAAAKQAQKLEQARLEAEKMQKGAATTTAQKKAAERVAAQRATAPTRAANNPAILETDVEAAPVGSAAKADSGFVGVKITSMPAERPAGVDLDAAKKQAPALANHIKAKGKNYTRSELALFQRRAGLVSDGLYGPLSQSALKFFGAKNAPAALHKGTVKAYTPPA